MKTNLSLLLLTLIISVGCSTTSSTWSASTPRDSGKPDTNIMLITSFVEQIVPVCYGKSNLPMSSIEQVINPDSYQKMLEFKNTIQQNFNGTFEELRVQNYDIARRGNTNIYVSQVQMLANIRENIILSNLLFTVEATGNRDVPFKVIAFEQQSFTDTVR